MIGIHICGLRNKHRYPNKDKDQSAQDANNRFKKGRGYHLPNLVDTKDYAAYE